MSYTEAAYHGTELGEGAFSIVFPGPLFTPSRKRPTAAYRAFRASMHNVVGDPERQRGAITQAVGRLAHAAARGDDVLKLCPGGKGVTIVDPQTLVEEARYSVCDCGPVVAAALGEIVSALQNSTVSIVEAP